jgi:hypothetical protein
MELTAVQFRLFKGEVIAVFPYQIENSTNVMSYAHNGQHSGCNWDINNFSKAATESQYLPLKNELEQIGYNLKVIKKRSHKTYLKSFYNK